MNDRLILIFVYLFLARKLTENQGLELKIKILISSATLDPEIEK